MRVAYNRASLPFSLNQTGTLLNRHLAQFVSAIDNLLVTQRKTQPFLTGFLCPSLWLLFRTWRQPERLYRNRSGS